jgi:hypothetical protein
MTYLGAGLDRLGSLEMKAWASLSISLDSSRSIDMPGLARGDRLGAAPTVESLSYSPGEGGLDNGFRAACATPAIGVMPSDPTRSTCDELHETPGDSPGMGVAASVERGVVSSVSPAFVSFSSTSDTVKPATLRSRVLNTSWFAKSRLRWVAVTTLVSEVTLQEQKATHSVGGPSRKA